MRQLQPVLWTKGVLLSPQHLQMQDRYLEDLLSFRLGALAFRPWGFYELEIDREALAGGAFAVTSASGIMPDGLPFSAPLSDPVPPPKPLDEAWDPDRPTLEVYLTIPEYRPDGFNVASAQRDQSTRYRAELLMRRDENNGLAEKPVQVAKKNLRFLVEGESLDGSSALPVARVVRGSTGETTLDPRFVPPLLDIGASEHLMNINRRLVELLSAKSTMLSGMRRQRNASLADFGISDVANFWLLYTVNTHLPAMRHLVRDASRASGGAVLRDDGAGRRAHHILDGRPPAVDSVVRSCEPVGLLHAIGRDASRSTRDGGAVELRRVAAAQ